MVNHQEPMKSAREENVIDLLQIVKKLWYSRMSILGVTLSSVVIGVLVALTSPVKFTSGSIFIPQIGEQTKVGGSLGGLASLAGINLGGIGGGSEISPILYPKIVGSVSFKKALLETEITHQNSKISYRDFYLNFHEPSVLEIITRYTIGLPGTILMKFRGKSHSEVTSFGAEIISVTQEEFELFKRLDSDLSVSPNDKEGYVSLSFTMPDAIKAAEMAKNAQDLLQREVIAFRIKNAEEQLKYTEQRYLEKKSEFEKIQSKLASFRDRNQNISSAQMLNQVQQLESEYNFALNIYTELAKQFEQAKLQVSKETPVFSIIQPVSVPLEKSAPKRGFIVILSAFFGIIISIVFLLGKDYFKSIQHDWNSSNRELI
jgi:hypothetical protein